VRVSTDRQSQEGHSLADQERRLKGYAQSIGVPVADVFIEAGVSGGKRLSIRPKGAQLLAKLRRGDHVIATKLDRMFRSASDALNVAEDFRAKGIHLHLLDIGGEVTGNGVAKLVFAILAAVSQMERERIGERVRNVKEHLRDAGYYTGGKLARGFRTTKDGRIEADPNWERCLAKMRELRAAGSSYRKVVDLVAEEFGIRMDYSTAYRVLKGQRRLDHVEPERR
jgi:DNA invertase Pin-like site-specific DNA recombinase